MITDILLAVAIISANSVSGGIVEQARSNASTYGVVYDDDNDTTSFANAGEISETDPEYAEVYGIWDVYDYISYTAL